MSKKILAKIQIIIRSNSQLTDQQVMRYMDIASYLNNRIVINELRSSFK